MLLHTGHIDIETNMSIYTHVTTETIEKTTDLLINYLKEKKKKAPAKNKKPP